MSDIQIADKQYLPAYHKLIGKAIESLISNFDFSEERENLDYLTKASAVYSSNIEGNSIDLNSFMNYELCQQKTPKNREIIEIENLITAYNFAHNNKLTEKNILACHETLSETLLIKSNRGKYRTDKVGVFGKAGLVYLAVEPEFVSEQMKKLFTEIILLLQQETSIEEIFYYAALIHLRFVHIHPFRDGNGRAARLLEKWFIAEKAGSQFWCIPSEEYYKNNQQEYYNAINLGVNFYELNYEHCLDFLQLLSNCINDESKKQ